MMENFGTQVIYVRGNHDDFLDNLAPLNFYNIQIVKDCIYESHGRRYYVTHGDIFDTVTTRMKWLAKLGDNRIHVFALAQQGIQCPENEAGETLLFAFPVYQE